MECQRLTRLVKSWYLDVQDEALAPARMVEFMQKHIKDCDVCLTDPDVRYEVKKITEIVLPPSKMTKQPKADETTEGPPPGPVSDEAEDEEDEDNEVDDDDDDDVVVELDVDD